MCYHQQPKNHTILTTKHHVLFIFSNSGFEGARDFLRKMFDHSLVSARYEIPMWGNHVLPTQPSIFYQQMLMGEWTDERDNIFNPY